MVRCLLFDDNVKTGEVAFDVVKLLFIKKVYKAIFK